MLHTAGVLRSSISLARSHAFLYSLIQVADDDLRRPEVRLRMIIHRISKLGDEVLYLHDLLHLGQLSKNSICLFACHSKTHLGLQAVQIGLAVGGEIARSAVQHACQGQLR